MVLVTPSNANSNLYRSIAYISCDPEAYAYGNITPYKTIQIAVGQSPSAILLYSNTSNHCIFQAVGNLGFDVIFTMTSASNSTQLASGLMGSGSPDSITMITLDQNSVKNGSSSSGGGSDVLGPSPTTAVAMIILYSITGIITALFLVIIITGALRAHRHPERYGPRNVLGRPRQSRAKGIARAMLETLPIVKFGDHEDVKPAANDTANNGVNNRDVELGAARGTENAQVPPKDVEPRRSSIEATQGSHSHEGDVVNTTAAEGAIEAAEPPKAEGSEEHPIDNGLACSVCTDDFIKGQDIRVLPCNHKFHPECIDPWLLNVSGTCPLW